LVDDGLRHTRLHQRQETDWQERNDLNRRRLFLPVKTKSSPVTKAAAGVTNQSVLGYSLQLKIPRHMLRGVFILSGLGQEKIMPLMPLFLTAVMSPVFCVYDG
jgi:hypothetical protein